MPFFATSIYVKDMHFHLTTRTSYLNKLTQTVCLRNAKTTYIIFRNDYLQPFQEGLKEEKANPEAARRKSYPILPMTSKLRHTDISATSSRRTDVSTTLFWRPTPAGMLIKQVKAQPAHDVLTSMRRDLRRIDVDTNSFCHSVCHAWVSKAVSKKDPSPAPLLLIDCLTDSTDYTLFAI